MSVVGVGAGSLVAGDVLHYDDGGTATVTKTRYAERGIVIVTTGKSSADYEVGETVRISARTTRETPA